MNHRNSLRPIGFCAETHRLMFVYEHVQKGSLYDHLYMGGFVLLINTSCQQVLGTPTREEIKCMNPNYTEFKFPQIKAHPWHKVNIIYQTQKLDKPSVFII